MSKPFKVRIVQKKNYTDKNTVIVLMGGGGIDNL